MINQESTVYLVEEKTNPSTDFFVAPYLNSLGCTVERYSLKQLPTTLSASTVQIVFVRYISTIWQKWIEQNKHLVSSVSFFMDDDLFDIDACKGLPLSYRFKLLKLAWRKQAWLKKVNAKIFVSNTHLQNKYHLWQPSVLKASYPRPFLSSTTVFYHGSASHRAEISWLKPIIERLLTNRSSVSFEIIGDRRVNAMFRSIPGVHVLHPMSWSSYRSLLARGGRNIGLAPLLEVPFNDARSHTKFFDITAAGAVGIYADHPVYSRIVESGRNGILVKMEPESWYDALNTLIDSSQLVSDMYQNAIETCEVHTVSSLSKQSL